MIVPRSVSEQLMFSTARIEADTPRGTSVGTGFFFQYAVDGERNLPVIVTNKHVVAGAERGRFRLHLAGQNEDGKSKPIGKSVPVELDQFEARWFTHPDKSVDLCAMPIAPLLSEVAKRGESAFFIPFDPSLLPSEADLEGMQTVESILMIGYPNGLWDEINNLPLFRRGITATHPAIDHQGKAITVIDAACFPGSSGSPVLIADEGGYATKGDFVVGSRVKLLGVLFSGPVMTAHGEIVIETIPTGQKAKALTQLMMHLGFIIKSKEIAVLGDAMVKSLLPTGGRT